MSQGEPKSFEERFSEAMSTPGIIYPVPEYPTLRDQFAMAALTGLCASIGWRPSVLVHEDKLADDAYGIADAMLAERSKTEEA